MYSIATPEYFSMLYKVTKWHLINANKKCDLEYRNNLLVILNTFASRESFMNLFVESNIIDLLLHTIGNPEYLYENEIRNHMTELDKEFFLLVWYCIKTLLKNEDCLYLIKSSEYIRVLLHYIDLSSQSELDKIYWTHEQAHILCINSLKLLQTVVQYLPEEFNHIMGIHILFRNIRYYLSEREECEREIEPGMKLCSIISGIEMFKETFCQNDVLSYFLELLCDYQMGREIKESICIIISNVCLPRYTDNHIVFRDKSGIDILIDLITHEEPRKEAGLRTLITILNAIWVNVIDCEYIIII